MTEVATELRRHGDRVGFVVQTDLPLYQDRLVKMGWQPDDERGVFIRLLDDAPDVDRTFERFSRHIETMLRQLARLETIDWQSGLADWADRVEGSGLRWWLYGSGALAVRGLDIEPGDLDLHVDDAAHAGRLMADLLVEPVTQLTGWVADAVGRAWSGVLIEWLAGAHPTGSEPPHEQEEAAARYLESIAWRGRTIPVPRLELPLAGAQRHGRADRIELIRRAIGS